MGIPNFGKDWKNIDCIPAPANAEVLLWKFDPRDFISLVDQMIPMLSATEKNRLDRFLDPFSRDNFIVCRGVLHILLAVAAGCPLEMVNITDSKEGKPQFAAEDHTHPTPFNLSHTESLCVIAISKDFEVGVDVEKIHELKELSSLARTYFSNDEWAVWLHKSDVDKLNGFYENWCAKEAILKAAGCGLAIHPGQINMIEAQEGQPLRGVQENGFFFEFRDFVIDPLPLREGYKGWLAVFGKPDVVSRYNLTPQVLAASIASLSEGRNVEK